MGTFDFNERITVNKVVRSKLNSSLESANVHHLANAVDIAIGLPGDFGQKIKELSNSSTSLAAWHDLREQAGLGKKGLLGLYVISKDSAPKDTDATSSNRLPLNAVDDLLGIAIFFPPSRDSTANVDYFGPPPLEVSVADEDSDELLEQADALDAIELEGSASQ